MRSAKIIFCILSISGAGALAQRISSPPPAQGKRIVLAASTVLDGKGHVLHDTRIVVEGSKILAMEAKRYGTRVNAVVPAARTRMTEDSAGTKDLVKKPDDGSFDVFGPEHVSPVVAYLAMADCPLTGRVFMAKGGDIRPFVPWQRAPWSPVREPVMRALLNIGLWRCSGLRSPIRLRIGSNPGDLRYTAGGRTRCGNRFRSFDPQKG